jgi:Leucine-rich repeat (LRR) protein
MPEASSSTATSSALALARDLLDQIQQVDYTPAEQMRRRSQAIIEQAQHHNQRYMQLQSVLSAWLDGVPETQRAQAVPLFKKLLHARPTQKSLTIDTLHFELPNFTPFFENLETLDITTQLEHIPASFQFPPSLTHLVLNAKHLTALPEQISLLPKLKKLTLSGCQHLEALPTRWNTFNTLTQLNVNNAAPPNLLPNNLHILPSLGSMLIQNSVHFGNSLVHLIRAKKLQKLTLCALSIETHELESLGQLKQLKFLEISGTRVHQAIPESLGQLSNLTDLVIKCDQLTELPNSIGALSKLKKLTLNNCINIIRLPDRISELQQLQQLTLSGCNQLSLLPDRIGELQQLQKLTVSECYQLSHLPHSIAELPHSCAVSIQNTALSSSRIETLSRQIELRQQASQGRQGPQLSFSLRAAATTTPIGTLSEEIRKWFQEAGAHSALSERARHNLAQVPERLANAMATLLARFRNTAAYIQSPSKTAQRILKLMGKLLNHQEPLLACCAMALESNETCDDRTALGLLHMELALLEFGVIEFVRRTQDCRQAYDLAKNAARGIFKQRRIMDIAIAHAQQAKGAVDETEIVMKFLLHLSGPLQLPIKLDQMLHEQAAWQVKQTDLDQAKQAVLHSDHLDNPRFVSFLANWHPWQETVKHQAPEEYQQIQAQLAEKDNAHEERLQTLMDEYTRLCDTSEHGELNAKALNKKAQINALPQQREQDRASAWLPHMLKVFQHTPAESSSAQANKRQRINPS